METESVEESMGEAGAAAEEQPTVASTEDKNMDNETLETHQENQAPSASNAAETEEANMEQEKN